MLHSRPVLMHATLFLAQIPDILNEFIQLLRIDSVLRCRTGHEIALRPLGVPVSHTVPGLAARGSVVNCLRFARPAFAFSIFAELGWYVPDHEE